MTKKKEKQHFTNEAKFIYVDYKYTIRKLFVTSRNACLSSKNVCLNQRVPGF